MNKEFDVSVTIHQLKLAGTDSSKQVPPLVELGNWYLKKAKTTLLAADFTNASGLYNAALARCRSVKHDIGEDQILRRIVETYREFLYAFAKDDEESSADEIQNEIHFYKEWIAHERSAIKERLDEIDSRYNRNGANVSEGEYEIHAEKIYEVFRDIQDMYIRLVLMFVKKCESRLGHPPCDYAIIALGSVARMEATPFSDLEFAILYSDPAIGDKIEYFRLLSHFLHLKVINLGETILPALAIKQLNDFQSSDPSDNWFYDSETPRGIAFDGAMPWASKTPLGRIETGVQDAIELIRTPEKMAQLQDEKFAMKEKYHLADIMSRASLLFGETALLDEYNERIAVILNTRSSVATCKSTVGFTRGIQQMTLDLDKYHPKLSYFGNHCSAGGLFDTKKQFYRLISLLLSDLGLLFDIRCPSPWEAISGLQTRGIIDEFEAVRIKVCLSIANEIRLKTYFANKGQKELLSPISGSGTTASQSPNPPIFRYFEEDTLIRLLSISNDMHHRCHEFSLRYNLSGEIDTSIFRDLYIPSTITNTTLKANLYIRLQNFPKALELLESESKDSSDYSVSLNNQGIIHNAYGEHKKAVQCFENALEVHRTRSNSGLSPLSCRNNLGSTLINTGQYNKARIELEETVKQHEKIYGKDFKSITLSRSLESLGLAYQNLGEMDLAIKTYEKAEKMHNSLKDVPDVDVMRLDLNLAMWLSEIDRHERSLEYVKHALHLSKKLFGEDDLSIVLSQVYVNASIIYEHCNLNKEALSLYKRALEILQHFCGDKPHPGKISCLNNMGNFFSRRNQTNEAVRYLESALEQARAVYLGKPHFTIASTLSNLGVALKRAEKSQESLPYFEEAREIMDHIMGPDHPHHITSDILNNMGTIFQDLGRLEEALQCYEDVHKMNTAVYGEDGVNDAMATVCSNIACVSEELENFDQAKEYYSKAVEIDRKITSTKNTSPGLVSSLYGLSSICEVLGEEQDSLKHLEEAREVAKSAGSKNFMLATVLLELGMKYNEMGSVEKGKACLQETKEMAESLAHSDASFMELLELLKNV